MPETASNILDGYIPEPDFAREGKISLRTSHRYRSQANGLPYVEFGGRIYIPVEDAKAWLKSRVKRPNARRPSR